MPITDMTFDPAICGWDRPGGVYQDGLRIYKKSPEDGHFHWCRKPTQEELLWIYEHDHRTKLRSFLQDLKNAMAGGDIDAECEHPVWRDLFIQTEQMLKEMN